MKEEVKVWLEKARGDLQKAKDNLTIRHYDLVSFLCHQSAEKALKATIIESTKEFPKIHDLVRLGKIIKIDAPLLSDCEQLNFAYTETRYPDVRGKEYTKEQAQEDLKSAERILRWTIKRLLSKN